jgi:hypothetical protein
MFSCGSASNSAQIPSDIAPIVAKFQQDALAQNHVVDTDSVQYSFQSLGQENGEQEIGDCQMNSDGSNPTVIIDTNSWASFSDTQKEMLVYHELGHCVLGRVHDSSYWAVPSTAFSIVNSLMYPSQTDASNYEIYRDHYMQELFANATK